MRHLVTVIIFMAALLGVTGGSQTAFARDPFAKEAGLPNDTPKELEGIGITPHLGETIDTSLRFKDETGKDVALRDFMADGKPVVLSLAYFNCPSLCSTHLHNLVETMKAIPAPIGQEFKFIIVSIDPRETPALAAEKKAAYLKEYGRPETAGSWHLLTGQEPQIAALAKQVGFEYRWSEEEKQYAHASAAYVLTPDGVISRYLNGIVFYPKDLRLSIIEASNGNVGTIVDKLVLFCFHFDPKASKYTIAAVNVMRAGGALMVLIIGGLVGAQWIPHWLRRGADFKEMQ